MAINNRVVVLVDDAMLAWLKARSAETMAPVGAIVRRAVQNRIDATGVDLIVAEYEEEEGSV